MDSPKEDALTRLDVLVCGLKPMIDNLNMIYYGLEQRNGVNCEESNAIFFVTSIMEEKYEEFCEVLRDLRDGGE